MKPSELPSTFYRVTAKALVFDEHRRLLVCQSGDTWEMPGGGWEHDEPFDICLEREVQEELGVSVQHVDDIAFLYRGKSSRGYYTIRIAVPVKLSSYEFLPGDGMTGAKFVTRDEFLALNFAKDEAPVKDCVDRIWPPAGAPVEKTTDNL